MGNDPPSVLIVEDDVLIRMNSAAALSDAGFEVHEATDATQALRTLTDYPEIEAICTDIKIPGFMDGQSLASEVMVRWPHIRVILTSGLTMGDAMPVGSSFLSKPYTDDELVASLRNRQN